MSLDEFKAATARFLTPHIPFISDAVDSTIQTDAYNDPYSAFGVYFAGALTAANFTQPQASAAGSINLLQLQAAIQQDERNSMAGLLIPGAFQVNIQMVAGGRLVENVIGVVNAAGNVSDAAAAVQSAWEQSGGPLKRLTDLVAMTNYHVVDVGDPAGDIFDLASSTVGGLSGDAIATRAACCLVRWNGATRSRSSRGRLYLGPIADVNIQGDGATLTTTAQGDFDTAFTAFTTGLSFNAYPLAVLSRTLNQAFLVSSHSVEATIATQRRRLRS